MHSRHAKQSAAHFSISAKSIQQTVIRNITACAARKPPISEPVFFCYLFKALFLSRPVIPDTEDQCRFQDIGTRTDTIKSKTDPRKEQAYRPVACQVHGTAVRRRSERKDTSYNYTGSQRDTSRSRSPPLPRGMRPTWASSS